MKIFINRNPSVRKKILWFVAPVFVSCMLFFSCVAAPVKKTVGDVSWQHLDYPKNGTGEGMQAVTHKMIKINRIIDIRNGSIINILK